MRNSLNLNPDSVFYYFEQLAKIPHGSGNTKAVSDYCVNFAKEHNLECHQDAVNNVIIIKEATKGYEWTEILMAKLLIELKGPKMNKARLALKR